MTPQDYVNVAWFAGWLAAVAVLFWVALRLPLQTRLRRLAARSLTVLTFTAMIAIGALAYVAVALHDVHFDLTREKIYTPSEKALAVVDQIDRPVKLTYFYLGQDQNGLRARAMVKLMGQRNPLLSVQTVDPDKDPILAREEGIPGGNTALLEAEGRRVMIRTIDEDDIAIGIQRVLRKQQITVCFISGHNEYSAKNFEFHTHVEGVAGHHHGGADSAVIKTTQEGMGRLRRVLESLGYTVNEFVLAKTGEIPPSCNVAIDAGPRTTYLPDETKALETYMRHGGSVLLMYDLGFALEPGLRELMKKLGIRLPQAVVIDSKSHYGKSQEMVAVTDYDKMSITKNIALTFYPGVRPLVLTPPARGVQTRRMFASSNESTAEMVRAVMQRQVAEVPPNMPPGFLKKPQAHALAAISQGKLDPSDDREFRAIVVGDNDFASNSFLPFMSNSDLTLSMIRWLVHEEKAARISSKIPVPPLIMLTAAQMQGVFLFVEILLPLVVLGLGGLIWWRRR